MAYVGIPPSGCIRSLLEIALGIFTAFEQKATSYAEHRYFCADQAPANDFFFRHAGDTMSALNSRIYFGYQGVRRMLPCACPNHVLKKGQLHTMLCSQLRENRLEVSICSRRWRRHFGI